MSGRMDGGGMSDFLLSFIAGAFGGTAAWLALSRRGRRAAQASVAPAPTPAAAQPVAAAAQSPVRALDPATEPDEDIGPLLARLNTALTPLAEEVAHPRELPDMKEFQAVVAAFRRPDAHLSLLSLYALGANWPFACAALVVLADHPERQSVRDAVLRHLSHSRPYVLMYAFRFLTSLEDRPPVGAAVLAAPAWWGNNAVIPDFFREYFARSAELGDTAQFGDLLDGKTELDVAGITGMLDQVEHPFAQTFIAALRAWEDARIDRGLLGTVGTLWDPKDRDPLLVSPPSWDEALTAAVSTILRSPARSLLISGDAHIGKSSFIKLLGWKLQDSDWTLFSASGNELMADQMYIGQLEGRIRTLVGALHARRRIVWYVRDLGQMANSGTHQGQSASILDQILPAVTAGNLIIVGEASQAAATRLFQARPSLRAVMEVLRLEPMDDEETLRLATDVSARITEHTGVTVSEQAVATTMQLARHYLGGGQLPGVVLELLKRAAASSISQKETVLTNQSVIATLSQISGLPSLVLDTGQRLGLAEVRDFFANKVMGQNEAVKAVVDRIAMLKAGLTDPGRPIGVFLFAGPTGTGKTELAKSLAEFLFGSAERMTRLDMSEFQTPESTAKIVGQRGDLTADSLIDRVRKRPFSVVLLDEFEKAHPNCWDLFLQIFDDGRLSDANGTEADFRHCFIILTSNLGATGHRGSGLGFRPDTSVFTDDQVMRTIAQTFRPEFINRLDKIIVFQPLSRELMRGILHKELAHVLERRGIREQSWAVEWEASAIEFLLDRGFSPEMGARPLKRAIDQLLLAPLAATMVEHRFPKGDQFLFVRSNGKEIEVEFVDPDSEPAENVSLEIEASADDPPSLASIILRQSGTAAERVSLTSHWSEIENEMASEQWRAANERLASAMADPAIWSREDRHQLFSRLEMADRLKEAARTAERLFRRYQAIGQSPARASRELAARLALQLYNLRQGLDDRKSDAPIDALLRVDPAMDGGDSLGASDWCEKLIAMYRAFADKRRMRLEEIVANDGRRALILHVTGFGAFRTLEREIGLHVLEDATGEATRRLVARVAVVSGPDKELRKGKAFEMATRLLDAAPAATTIVRRYRTCPSPTVRDMADGWRSGKLDSVLGGDFDLIGAVVRRRPAA
jgi:ATP-dependent Clp protease ATP-binding subunit ClpC